MKIDLLKTVKHKILKYKAKCTEQATEIESLKSILKEKELEIQKNKEILILKDTFLKPDIITSKSKSRNHSEKSLKMDRSSISSKENKLDKHEDLSNLYNEVNELQDENDKLIEENEKLEEILEQTKSKYEAEIAILKSERETNIIDQNLKEQNSALEKQLKEVIENNKLLEDTVRDLKRDAAISKLEKNEKQIENEIRLQKFGTLCLDNELLEAEVLDILESGAVSKDEENSKLIDDQLINLKSMSVTNLKVEETKKSNMYSINPFEYIDKMGINLCRNCMLQIRIADASNRNININLKHRNTIKEINNKKMMITANSEFKRKSQMLNNINGVKFPTKRFEFISQSSEKKKKSLHDSIEEFIKSSRFKDQSNNEEDKNINDNEEDSDEFQNTDSDKSKNKHSSTDSN